VATKEFFVTIAIVTLKSAYHLKQMAIILSSAGCKVLTPIRFYCHIVSNLFLYNPSD